MGDNKQIKDGLGNLFSIRMKDRTGDGVLMQSLILANLFPIDYGETGGIYQHTARSGTIVAGMVANSPIYSFRCGVTAPVQCIRRVRINAVALSAFSAGLVKFEMFQARAFIAQDTGGQSAVFTGHNTKMRTSMAQAKALIQWSATAAIAMATGSSRVLDVAPIEAINVVIGTAAPAMIVADRTLFHKPQGEHPLVLTQDEGFVIQATVPAGGTWAFTVNTEWDEVQIY